MPTNLDDSSFKESGIKLTRYRLVWFASSLVATKHRPEFKQVKLEI